jgi:serine/threonine protein kinase
MDRGNELAPGALFAREFRVIQPLRRGGMGVVYVVEQVTTGRRRALKVMSPDLLANEKMRARFIQEARVASQIASEHCVEVVSAGIDAATSIPWLAMELLEGEELSRRVRRAGAMSRDEMLEVLDQAGHALGAAHDAGIVHCDLKPDNLFVAVARRKGAPFVVKVLDFGIARLMQETRASVTVTTAMGSPMWMAPEQGARGAKLRPSTDVWALGLIAYWMLTGRSYWRTANVSDDQINFVTLFAEIAAAPIEPPSLRAREAGLEAKIPAGFDPWFLRCVDRDPDQRWRDARTALRALSESLGGAAADTLFDDDEVTQTITSRPVSATVAGFAAHVPATAPVVSSPSMPAWPSPGPASISAPMPGASTSAPIVSPVREPTAPLAEPPRRRRVVMLALALPFSVVAAFAVLTLSNSGDTRTTAVATVESVPPRALVVEPELPEVRVVPEARADVVTVLAAPDAALTAEPPSRHDHEEDTPRRSRHRAAADAGDAPSESVTRNPSSLPLLSEREVFAPRVDETVTPEGLTRAQVAEVMRPVNGLVRACVRHATLPIPVRMVVRGDGSVAHAEVAQPFAETPDAACIERLVARVRFPSAGATETRFTWPLTPYTR